MARKPATGRQRRAPDMIKYPGARVQLTGEDGNAFAIIGRVCKALREAGATPAETAAFTAEATSGDYDALLATCLRWVDVS